MLKPFAILFVLKSYDRINVSNALTFTLTFTMNCYKQELPICSLCITLALDQSH